ncbi:MAG TPA: formate dehydrogenase subunit delta [Caulobacteraceae bacterium]|jgi:formate dehydrogenase subunit delta
MSADRGHEAGREGAHEAGHSLFDDEQHITTSSDQRLVTMANQIARFFSSQKHDTAVEGCRDHIAKFWDPRMRGRIRAHVADGGAGLTPLAKEAIARLTR